MDMKHPIGIQIYTLRSRLQTEFAETLSLIRQIGFDNVEYVKNCIALSAEELSAAACKAGLSTCGVHVKSSDLLDDPSLVCSYAETIKSPYITTSLMPPTAFDSWKELVKYCREAGKKAAEAGLIFTYHNHWYEPEKHNDSSILEKILEETDPAEVALELDVAWVAAAGRDPAEFIEKFPDAYDTKIERGGTNVSGGQKQRLCIARALLKKPKILILDDSTSAVDTATDAKIRKAFREEIPNTTKLIIAQRISSVEDADHIIVMNEGKINGYGTHEELLKNNEIYRDIYELQQKGAEE